MKLNVLLGVSQFGMRVQALQVYGDLQFLRQAYVQFNLNPY